MAKISMLIADGQLAEIDAQAAGNRTAFMVAASLSRARSLRREQLDQEIAESLAADAESDLAIARDWDVVSVDGLG
jgi:hypothetical protein